MRKPAWERREVQEEAFSVLSREAKLFASLEQAFLKEAPESELAPAMTRYAATYAELLNLCEGDESIAAEFTRVFYQAPPMTDSGFYLETQLPFREVGRTSPGYNVQRTYPYFTAVFSNPKVGVTRDARAAYARVQLPGGAPVFLQSLKDEAYRALLQEALWPPHRALLGTLLPECEPAFTRTWDSLSWDKRLSKEDRLPTLNLKHKFGNRKHLPGAWGYMNMNEVFPPPSKAFEELILTLQKHGVSSAHLSKILWSFSLRESAVASAVFDGEAKRLAFLRRLSSSDKLAVEAAWRQWQLAHLRFQVSKFAERVSILVTTVPVEDLYVFLVACAEATVGDPYSHPESSWLKLLARWETHDDPPEWWLPLEFAEFI